MIHESGYPSLGYRDDLEDMPALAATARPWEISEAFTAPAFISHRAWRKKPKYQNGVGACSGFSRSSGEEILNWIVTGGDVKRFSDMYAYLENQKACGLYGRDNGATIEGSVRAAADTGICLESTFPFPGKYVTGIPNAAETEGKQHLIKSHDVLKSYADVFNWLASGTGVVLIGVPWTQGLRQVGKTVELSDAQGKPLGGHALVLEGYGGADGSAVKDGRPLVDLENSHGDQWGDGGWAMVEPDVIDYWADRGCALIGISDLTSYGFRQIKSWAEMFG